jgi:predicted permease
VKILTDLAGDVVYAARALCRTPLSFAAAVISIAIGAGVNAGIYGVLRQIVFASSVAGVDASRLVRVQPGLSFPNYQDLRRVDLPIELTLMQMATVTWRTGDETRPLGAHVVSYNFFETVAVNAIAGRAFTSADRERDDLVVPSYTFWQRQLRGDPSAVGSTLEINGAPYEIVGVLPRGFAATAVVGGMVYVPIGKRVTVALDNRNAAQFDVIGRLRDGVGRGEALAALKTAAAALEQARPEVERGAARTISITATDAFSMFRGQPVGRMLLAAATTIYGLVGLVLLIACANVTGLLLARTEERRRELATRIALGASRRRMAQHILAESLVISVLGCGLGIAAWKAGIAVVRNRIAASASADVTAFDAVAPVLYCLALVLFLTVAAGFGSAARVVGLASDRPTAGLLSVRSRRRSFVQHALVVGQVTVCFVLLTAAAFLLSNAVRLTRADPGFEIDRVVSVDIRRPPAAPARDALAIRDAIASCAGVSAVTWGSPIGPPFTERLQWADRSSDQGVRVDIRPIGPDFFAAMGVPVARGRDIDREDFERSDTTAVLVNDAFVRSWSAGADPLDQRLVRAANGESGRPRQTLRIVGVVPDIMSRTIGDERVPIVYVPQRLPSLTIRLNVAPTSEAMRDLRDRIVSLEPPGTLVTVVPFATDMRTALMPLRVAAALLATLGAIGLALASSGLYSTISHAVAQRRVEIGVRAALGATPSMIGRLFLGDGVRLVAIGCLCGAVLSALVSRALQAVTPLEAIVTPFEVGAVAALLLAIGIAASLQPALRAAALDPTDVLRLDL